MKCGDSKLNLPEAATHPISAGIAPGKAPTSVHSGVLLLSGVYRNKYLNNVRTERRLARRFTAIARYIPPVHDSKTPNRRTAPDANLPEASGRVAFASRSAAQQPGSARKLRCPLAKRLPACARATVTGNHKTSVESQAETRQGCD